MTRIPTPRQDLADITADAMSRGMSRFELLRIQKLGDDGYGVIAQMEQLYVWLEQHPRSN